MVSDEERAANAKAAEWPDDFDIVCKNGSVSNAGDYAEPYTAVAFYPGMQPDAWYGVAGVNDSAYDFSKINVVACLSRKAGTEVESGQCESKSWDKPISIDYYSVQYDIELREAKTGKKIKDLGTVNGPAVDCPSVTFFDWVPPKLFGEPDGAAVEAKLAEAAE
ncbi:hypothetical protein [Mycolicibacterium sp. XJ870]